MFKRIICMGAALMMCVGLLGGCVDPYRKINKQFDLSDPTDYWVGTVDDLSNLEGGLSTAVLDVVIITFKKTSKYPTLEAKDFSFNNSKQFSYNYITPPPDDDVHYWELWDYTGKTREDWRQTGFLYLKTTGHDKVFEAIEFLQKLKFIKRAEPMGAGKLPTG